MQRPHRQARTDKREQLDHPGRPTSLARPAAFTPGSSLLDRQHHGLGGRIDVYSPTVSSTFMAELESVESLELRTLCEFDDADRLTQPAFLRVAFGMPSHGVTQPLV